MLYYLSLSALFNAITALALALFIYARKPRSEINIRYAIFNLSVFAWAGCYFFWPITQNNKEETLFWFRILHFGSIFCSITYFHFICTFLGKHKKYLIRAGYIVAVFFSAFLFTPLFVKDVRPIFALKYWGVPGVLYPFYLIYFFFYVLVSLYLVFAEWRKAVEPKKTQYAYLLLATILGWIGGSVNYPLWYGIPIYPIFNVFVGLYVIMITYAIIKYQLLDIKVAIKKTLVFTGLLLAVLGILVLPALLIQEHLARNAGFGARMVGLAISGIIIIVSVRKIEDFLVNTTDRYLFQKKYDYKELLKTFSEEVLAVMNRRQLIELTEKKLAEIMRLESCRVQLGEGTAEAEMVMPLASGSDTLGALLLGRKKSDEPFTQDDKDILEPLTKTLAIAISNAELFDELAKTQAEAAQKEKMATIGTLAAGMAHEIRNPIMTIRTFADYIPDRKSDANFMQKFSRIIPSEISRVETIARSLLEFSHSETGMEKAPVNICGVIEAVTGIKCAEGETVTVLANKDQMHDAIYNLMQYISAETPEKSDLSFSVEKDGAIARLSIKCTDMVVPDYVLKDAFDASSKFDRTRRGFGFNLFLANQLLIRNGGKLTIAAIPTGTEFTITW